MLDAGIKTLADMQLLGVDTNSDGTDGAATAADSVDVLITFLR